MAEQGAGPKVEWLGPKRKYSELGDGLCLFAGIKHTGRSGEIWPEDISAMRIDRASLIQRLVVMVEPGKEDDVVAFTSTAIEVGAKEDMDKSYLSSVCLIMDDYGVEDYRNWRVLVYGRNKVVGIKLVLDGGMVISLNPKEVLSFQTGMGGSDKASVTFLEDSEQIPIGAELNNDNDDGDHDPGLSSDHDHHDPNEDPSPADDTAGKSNAGQANNENDVQSTSASNGPSAAHDVAAKTAHPQQNLIDVGIPLYVPPVQTKTKVVQPDEDLATRFEKFWGAPMPIGYERDWHEDGVNEESEEEHEEERDEEKEQEGQDIAEDDEDAIMGDEIDLDTDLNSQTDATTKSKGKQIAQPQPHTTSTAVAPTQAQQQQQQQQPFKVTLPPRMTPEAWVCRDHSLDWLPAGLLMTPISSKTDWPKYCTTTNRRAIDMPISGDLNGVLGTLTIHPGFSTGSWSPSASRSLSAGKPFTFYWHSNSATQWMVTPTVHYGRFANIWKIEEGKYQSYAFKTDKGRDETRKLTVALFKVAEMERDAL